jgi:nucleotide-binding universal stress UspA family protein
MYKKILVGYDGSEGSQNALLRAIALAKALHAHVQAVWVKSSLPHYPETVDEVQEENSAANEFFQERKKEIDSFAKKYKIKIPFSTQTGHAAKTIVDFAKKENVDLIIVGNAGHSGLWGNLLGHTPDKISENAHCSVLIVRGK